MSDYYKLSLIQRKNDAVRRFLFMLPRRIHMPMESGTAGALGLIYPGPTSDRSGSRPSGIRACFSASRQRNRKIDICMQLAYANSMHKNRETQA